MDEARRDRLHRLASYEQLFEHRGGLGQPVAAGKDVAQGVARVPQDAQPEEGWFEPHRLAQRRVVRPARRERGDGQRSEALGQCDVVPGPPRGLHRQAGVARRIRHVDPGEELAPGQPLVDPRPQAVVVMGLGEGRLRGANPAPGFSVGRWAGGEPRRAKDPA